MAHLIWEWGQTKHSNLGCMSQYPLDFPPCPISGIPRFNGLTTSATWGSAGCAMHKRLSPEPFKLLLLLSKHAFIFHEAEQGCHYNSGFHTLKCTFGKCLHVIYMTGRQPHHKRTSGEVCSSSSRTLYESVSGSYGSLVPLTPLLPQLLRILGESIIS